MDKKIIILIAVVILVVLYLKFKKSKFGITLPATPPVSALDKAILRAMNSVKDNQELVDACETQLNNINNLTMPVPELQASAKASLISAQDGLVSAQEQLNNLKQQKEQNEQS